MINNLNVIIQPFNEISTVSTDVSYGNTSRSTVVFQDYDIPYASPTSMFNLLSYFSLNQSVVNSFPSDVQKLLKLSYIGFFVVNTTITFQNIRFEDDYHFIENQKAIWFAPTKLESKIFTLLNVDIK